MATLSPHKICSEGESTTSSCAEASPSTPQPQTPQRQQVKKEEIAARKPPPDKNDAAASPHHSLSYAYQTYLRHDEAEQSHWKDVCRSYRQYASFALQQWANHQYRLASLPESQRQFLPPSLLPDTPAFAERAAQFKNAAIRNQFALDCILRHAGQAHSQQAAPSGSFSTDAQMSKVSSALKSLARDWSADGKKERDMTYMPILKRVDQYLPVEREGTTIVPRICVPGAGVGRLACELSAAGYSVQGNEFSLYMLLASDFILNGPVQTESPLQISPWLLESRNLHKAHDPMRVVKIPDVDPYEMIVGKRESSDDRSAVEDSKENDEKAKNTSDFSMAAGEFVSIYGADREKNQWDGVVACFFLDASPSLVEYLQIVFDMLKPGGYLINFGPLLWHWSGPAMRPDDKSFEDYQERYSYLDPKYLSSVDLSWEDGQQIMINMGYEIVEASTGHTALYTADRQSMMNMQYKCIQFVARKPLEK